MNKTTKLQKELTALHQFVINNNKKMDDRVSKLEQFVNATGLISKLNEVENITLRSLISQIR